MFGARLRAAVDNPRMASRRRHERQPALFDRHFSDEAARGAVGGAMELVLPEAFRRCRYTSLRFLSSWTRRQGSFGCGFLFTCQRTLTTAMPLYSVAFSGCLLFVSSCFAVAAVRSCRRMHV